MIDVATAHPDQFLWVEKWRPRSVDSCVLPKELSAKFEGFLEQGQLPNLILAGPSGVGKTTVARALCEQMGVTYLVINGSEETGIDVVRTKIRQFASTVSFDGALKVVILDEADYLNQNSTQPALRGFIEEFSRTCRFIFTCNYKNRILKHLHSRATVLDFVFPVEEKAELASKFFQRAKKILRHEEIAFDDKQLAAVVMRFFPDFRRTLNELQGHSASGTLSMAILGKTLDGSMAELEKALTTKNFNKMRAWVVEHIDHDPAVIFRKIYDTFLPKVKDPAPFVEVLAEYQYKAAFCHDQEVNLVAFLAVLMMSEMLR